MTPILFLDRDGTLIEEPEDFQIDSYEKLRFVPGVIPALLQLRDAGYDFVMVTNQDGLGTETFPYDAFDGPHQLMLRIFKSQGITFRDVFIDTTLPEENAPTRKPNINMVMSYVQNRAIDWEHSAMVGDRPTDVTFAQNLNIRSFQLRTSAFGGTWDWPQIAHFLCHAPRCARVDRQTNETTIQVSVDLDTYTTPHISTGIGFFDHMLEQIARHAQISLHITAQGDTHVDEHHTIEDTGIALGSAIYKALGNKRGIGRYGFSVPMDEALANAVVDLSGRAYFVFEGNFDRPTVGQFPTELVPHFFRSFSEALGMSLHLSVKGDNDHHKIEACFKVLGRALKLALHRDGHILPSTKGML